MVLPGKPLTTNFLFPLFKPIMVKDLSLSLESKQEIRFLRLSDLLTQNVHLVQNTLPTSTVNARKFDIYELKEIVVCVWQYFVDHGLRDGIVEALHLETECTWHFVSGGGVLFYLANGLSLEFLPQITPNALQWNLVT